MPRSVADSSAVRHLERLENTPASMAKADLKNLEKVERQAFGRVVARCFRLAGLTQKEAAAMVNRDQAQVARWESGDERPQMDVIFAVPQLRCPLVIALAERAGVGVEVLTEIRVRRA